jgi:hypothetical protein
MKERRRYLSEYGRIFVAFWAVIMGKQEAIEWDTNQLIVMHCLLYSLFKFFLYVMSFDNTIGFGSSHV